MFDAPGSPTPQLQALKARFPKQPFPEKLKRRNGLFFFFLLLLQDDEKQENLLLRVPGLFPRRRFEGGQKKKLTGFLVFSTTAG